MGLKKSTIGSTYLLSKNKEPNPFKNKKLRLLFNTTILGGACFSFLDAVVRIVLLVVG